MDLENKKCYNISRGDNMIKMKNISPYQNDALDNIDKFILKLVKYDREVPNHTSERIKETLKFLFLNSR